jgi:anaerobic magnesium-protoporphyrin IX monomethyl ester cyclase
VENLKVTFVVPNFRWASWDANTLWHYIPYNLCLLAAMIEDRCDVSILDANVDEMSEEAFIAEIKNLEPDVVGFTILMDQYSAAGHRAAELVKKNNKDVTTILGGVYASMAPEKVVLDTNIDYVVVGEGEYVIQELVDYFIDNTKPLPEKGLCYRKDDGEIVNTGHYPFIMDLDAIPLPAYHLLDYLKYSANAELVYRKSVDSPSEYPFARILTSRGCPVGCSFCQVESIMGARFRRRDIHQVLNEIDWLKNEYGIKSLIFDDDALFLNKNRMKDFFREMIKRDLTMPWLPIAAGVYSLDEEMIDLLEATQCQYLDLAIESGVERIIKDIIKKPINFDHVNKIVRLAQKAGIYVAANFIIGFPTETWTEIRQTIKYAEDLNLDYMKLFVANPLPNTQLWAMVSENDSFKEDFENVENRRWSAGQIETQQFKATDLTFLRAYEWDRINFTDPKRLKRTADQMHITVEELNEIRRTTLDNATQLVQESKARPVTPSEKPSSHERISYPSQMELRQTHQYG